MNNTQKEFAWPDNQYAELETVSAARQALFHAYKPGQGNDEALRGEKFIELSDAYKSVAPSAARELAMADRDKLIQYHLPKNILVGTRNGFGPTFG